MGWIVGVQGLRGELRVKPSSEFPERFTKPGTRWLRGSNEEEPKEVRLKKGRKLPGKSVFVIRLEGIDTRDEAECQIGQEILVSAKDRPKLGEGEYHMLDLLGLEAKLKKDGEPIGIVSDLIKGGNDLLEISTAEGKKLMIPFVKEIVPEVQVGEGWLLITPPPGLLEL